MIITISPPQNVQTINLGAQRPKLGGTINVTQFTNLNQFIGSGGAGSNPRNFFAAIDDFIVSDANTKLWTIDIKRNNLTGSAIQYMPPNIINIDLASNCLHIPLSDLSGFTKLKECDLSYNPNMGGGIPTLPDSIEILDVLACGLDGTISSLNNCVNLDRFRVTVNSPGLTGTIPSLSNCVALDNFQCHNNRLTGNIPDISNTALRLFDIDDNQLSGWEGGTIPSTIRRFKANNNNLSKVSVLSILESFYESFHQASINAPGATIRLDNQTVNNGISDSSDYLPNYNVTVGTAKSRLFGNGFTSILL